jgi:hypothetical protein
MYKLGTGKTNCRNHLIRKHSAVYDQTVQEKQWPFRLSNEKRGAKTAGLPKRVVPRFTLDLFIEYLVRFIVANDQVRSLPLSLSLTHVLTLS